MVVLTIIILNVVLTVILPYVVQLYVTLLKVLALKKVSGAFQKNEFEFQNRIYWQSGKLKAFSISSISLEKKFEIGIFCKIAASVSDI
jgi:hypothetical protein